MAEPQDNAAPGYVSPMGPECGPECGPWTFIPSPPYIPPPVPEVQYMGPEPAYILRSPVMFFWLDYETNFGWFISRDNTPLQAVVWIDNTMYVVMRDRRVFIFFNVTENNALLFADAASPWLYFNQIFLGNYGMQISFIDTAQWQWLKNILFAKSGVGVIFVIPPVPATPPTVAGLINDGGVVQLAQVGNYPTSPVGLLPGALWSNGLLVSVVPGATPNPAAPKIFFSMATAASLLATGGGNLPLSNPAVGQLWNNGGVVSIGLTPPPTPPLSTDYTDSGDFTDEGDFTDM